MQQEFIVRRHASASSFLHKAQHWLLNAEAENNLILGIADRLRRHPDESTEPVYLATILRNGEIAGCAFRTGEFKLGLTRMPQDSIPVLIEDIGQVYDSLPAVLGDPATAREFAALWAAKHECRYQLGMQQGIYELSRVIQPDRPFPGKLKLVTQTDFEQAQKWSEAFHDELDLPVRFAARTEQLISERMLFFWEDGQPCAMAAGAASTPNGIRIGYVYTPPHLRGRGYATACVAQVSQFFLDAGKKFCFLYTDLANPTSNKIYQRIGYRKIAEVVDVLFSV